MIKRANIALIVLAGVLSTGDLFAQVPSSQSGSSGNDQKAMEAQGSTVFLLETFDNFEVDSVPSVDQLQRSNLVKVADGGGKVGSGKVAHFNDNDTETGGAIEYTVGEAALSNLYIEFDALNNDNAMGDKNSQVIFGVGHWEEGKSLVLNSKSKRAFGF